MMQTSDANEAFWFDAQMASPEQNLQKWILEDADLNNTLPDIQKK